MQTLDPELASALATYPPIILALIVVLVAFGFMYRSGSKERTDMEASRKEERKERDERHDKSQEASEIRHRDFMREQSEANRAAGLRQAEVMKDGLNALADSNRELTSGIRDLGRDLKTDISLVTVAIQSAMQSMGGQVSEVRTAVEGLRDEFEAFRSEVSADVASIVQNQEASKDE